LATWKTVCVSRMDIIVCQNVGYRNWRKISHALELCSNAGLGTSVTDIDTSRNFVITRVHKAHNYFSYRHLITDCDVMYCLSVFVFPKAMLWAVHKFKSFFFHNS
jgi:hypothetical protein